MTAQAIDILYYRGKEYTLLKVNQVTYPVIGSDREQLFSPEDFGFDKKSIIGATCCYRGYYSEYSIIDGQLFLTKFTVSPRENGVHPVIDAKKPEKVDFITLKKQDGKEAGALYTNIKVQSNFTGEIIIGDQFYGIHYADRGNPFTYQHYIIFKFKNGLIANKNYVDNSQFVKAQEFIEVGDFKALANLTDLKLLRLSLSPINNKHLAYLSPLTSLEELGLSFTEISDTGLVHLKPLTKLKKLRLDNTKIKGFGLVHLKPLTSLETLTLIKTEIEDVGLTYLESLTNLKKLDLGYTKISDAGVAHLKSLTNLAMLSLGSDKISDAGVAHLKSLTNLAMLTLSGDKISDTGLMHLKSLQNLSSFFFSGRKVSKRRLEKLRSFLPNTYIQKI